MNDLQFKTYNEFGTHLFFEELSRLGVQDIFVAPGSRSTPLLLACAQNEKFNIHTHFDERGLAFWALGCAKSTKNPCVIITTSGTAVANLLPAIVEAYYSRTPLIICSADRPFELLDVGANQAIHQKNIFQNFVHNFSDVPPQNSKFHFDSLLTLAAKMFLESKNGPGPVHINWQFQEPLAPLKNELKEFQISPHLTTYLHGTLPFTQLVSVNESLLNIDLGFLRSSKKVLLLYGSMTSDKDSTHLLQIAETLKAPVFCDVQNPLKFKKFPQNILRSDLLLEVTEIDSPDVIMHFGGPFTSKRINQFLQNFKGIYVQINDLKQNVDPNHLKKTFISSNTNSILSYILKNPLPTDSHYLDQIRKTSDRTEEFLKSELDLLFNKNDLNEITLPIHLCQAVHSAQVFVGSSMPIRDFERFGSFNNFKMMFNRGASGIDGNIATACGFAINSTQKTICVLGDQTFLYDVNSLALIRQSKNPVHIVVVNNSGGGIFSFLPVSGISEKNIFHNHFTVPHEWNLKSCAEAFHLNYQLARNAEDFRTALESNYSTLIEIKTDINTNVRHHRQLTENLTNTLRTFPHG